MLRSCSSMPTHWTPNKHHASQYNASEILAEQNSRQLFPAQQMQYSVTLQIELGFEAKSCHLGTAIKVHERMHCKPCHHWHDDVATAIEPFLVRLLLGICQPFGQRRSLHRIPWQLRKRSWDVAVKQRLLLTKQ